MQSSTLKNNLREILPDNTLKTFVPQVEVKREIKTAPPRYRNEIAQYIVYRDESLCKKCHACVETCPKGVFVLKKGYSLFATPNSHRCNGSVCEKSKNFCVARCPQGALRLVRNPVMEVLGDYRWTADIILATWHMSETGELPPEDAGIECEFGDSGGGFDRIAFKFPKKPPVKLSDEDIDISLKLNKRNDGRPNIKIDVPWSG